MWSRLLPSQNCIHVEISLISAVIRCEISRMWRSQTDPNQHTQAEKTSLGHSQPDQHIPLVSFCIYFRNNLWIKIHLLQAIKFSSHLKQVTFKISSSSQIISKNCHKLFHQQNLLLIYLQCLLNKQLKRVVKDFPYTLYRMLNAHIPGSMKDFCETDVSFLICLDIGQTFMLDPQSWHVSLSVD